MTDIAQELLDILDIEQLEVDLFRGVGSNGETSVRIFGGQVIAQAAVLSQSFLERENSRVLEKFMRPSWQIV